MGTAIFEFFAQMTVSQIKNGKKESEIVKEGWKR